MLLFHSVLSTYPQFHTLCSTEKGHSLVVHHLRCTLSRFVVPFQTIKGSIGRPHPDPKNPYHPTGYSKTILSLVGPYTTHDPSIHWRY